MNPLIVLALAALIPLIVGSAWYSPFLFQKPWMAATGMKPEDSKASNMFLNMILLYVFSFFIAAALLTIVVHQFGLYSMLGAGAADASLKDPNSELHKVVAALYNMHGHSFRTYKHGALHGTIAAITLALPLIATSAVFEKRGLKYVLITWGFWLVNFILMGAVICHWTATPLDALTKIG